MIFVCSYILKLSLKSNIFSPAGEFVLKRNCDVLTLPKDGEKKVMTNFGRLLLGWKSETAFSRVVLGGGSVQLDSEGWEIQGLISPTCLWVAFTHEDPRKRKKLLEMIVFFALLGSACVKAACKMMVKLTPGSNPINQILSWRDKNSPQFIASAQCVTSITIVTKKCDLKRSYVQATELWVYLSF